MKTQRLRAEFEADIVLRVMKYSAGEAAKTGWRGGGGHRGAEGSGRSFRRGRDDGASAGEAMTAADIRASGNEQRDTRAHQEEARGKQPVPPCSLLVTHTGKGCQPLCMQNKGSIRGMSQAGAFKSGDPWCFHPFLHLYQPH